MRLRRKPWVDEAIHAFDGFVIAKDQPLGEERKGTWREAFGREAPLHVELGTGKGDFICRWVVNSAGRTVPGWTEQRELLEAEGVGFKANGNVDMSKFRVD